MKEKKFFEIAGIKGTIRETPEVLTSSDGKETIKFDERLIPKDIKYVVADDAKNDPARAVLMAIENGMATLLVGPKGTWKTTTAAYIAQKLNRPLMYMQMTGSTWVDSFIGKYLVNTHEGTYWVDWILTQAMKYGYILVLDELNMALPEITAVLHWVMDERKILVLDEKWAWEVIVAHPDFRIVAAINPSGEYEGTKEMNEALMDRFQVVVPVDYPDARKERAIVLAKDYIWIDDDPEATSVGRTKDGIISRMVMVANDARKAHGEQRLEFEFSTRNLIDWARLTQFMPVKEAAELSIISKISEKWYKKIIREFISIKFKDNERWLPESERGEKVQGRGQSVAADRKSVV